MSNLVSRLKKAQAVEFCHRPRPTLGAFKRALQRRYVHLRFPATRGGTELGIRLAVEESDFSKADLTSGTGGVVVVGDLTLDYVPVRLRARIDLPTLNGVGCLETLAAQR